MQNQKIRKRQQRLERQQAKEAEHEAEMKVVTYTLRIQDMLNAFGDEDKDNFRTGTEGAVVSRLRYLSCPASLVIQTTMFLCAFSRH